MLQTAYGSLTVGVQAAPGQSLLVRGGTSSIGLALIVLAKRLGMTVYATTRREQARPQLEGLDDQGFATPGCRGQPRGSTA